MVKCSKVFSKLRNFLQFSWFPCCVLDLDTHLTFFSITVKPLRDKSSMPTRHRSGTSNVPVPTQHKTAFHSM